MTKAREPQLRTRFVVASLGLLLAFSACKTKSELRREQEFERIKQEVTKVTGERADIETQVEDTKTELARLASAFDEHAAANKTQIEELKREMNALTTRVQAMEQRAVDEAMAERKAAEEKSKATFDSGKKLFDEERYEEAADVFRAVIKARPRTDEGKKSQYYLAESFFNAKDYASAALEFGQFNKSYPRDPLVPTAIYRQAHAFRNMGKTKEAKLFYQELIDRFPKSQLTAKAKGEMKKLK